MKQKAIIILFACLWVNSSFAQENIIQDNSNPGIWELSLQTKENDKVLMNKSVQKCVTKEYLDKNSKINIDDIWDKNKLACKRTSLSAKGNETNIGFVCSPVSKTSEVVQIEINSSYMSDKTTSHLITEYKTKDKTGTKKTLNTSINGKRVGNC
jgi:Protein of unknown function (DUF3617)